MMCVGIEVNDGSVGVAEMMEGSQKNIFLVHSNIYFKAALVYQSELKLDKA